MTWPNVLDEDDTLDLLLQGRSIARFGDGEFRLLEGNAAIAQEWSPKLQGRLHHVLRHRNDRCLVGIPRMDVGPKKGFWSSYKRMEKALDKNGQYYSAFITRPDSATWIDRPDYWKKIRRLWEGKAVTLVRGTDKSLTADIMPEALHVHEIIAPARNAWSNYDAIMEEIYIDYQDLVILCLGPAATVMAESLSGVGRQALDLGHLGMFLRKHLRGEPMAVTEADKAVDRVQ